MKLFGSRAYTRIHNIPKKQKMKPRAFIGYLVGYRASNIWRVWNPVRKEVIEARDIDFDEKKLFDPKDAYAADHLRIAYNDLQHQTISAPYFTPEFVADDSKDKEIELTKEVAK